MSREDYFLMDELGFGSEGPNCWARLKDLTQEEAKAITDALEIETGGFPVTLSLIPESKVRKNTTLWLAYCHQAEQAENISFDIPQKDSLFEKGKTRSIIMAKQFAGLLREKLKTDTSEPSQQTQRFEVYDEETEQWIGFDATDSKHWGPEEYDSEWHLDHWTYRVKENLYRHKSGHWTLISERNDYISPDGYIFPKDAKRIDEKQAITWLVRYGHKLPGDLAKTAESLLFKPGEPKSKCLPDGDSQKITASPVPSMRISVTLHPPTITYDGTVYAVEPDGATFIDTLVKADGEWVVGNKLDMRADRVKKKLPKAIENLVESGRGKGYRIPRKYLA